MNAAIDPAADARIAGEVLAERGRQDGKWGVQDHPDGTGGKAAADEAALRRTQCAEAAAAGRTTFRHILAEEVAEAFAETDPVALRAELAQVAAVAMAWMAKLDRHHPPRGIQRGWFVLTGEYEIDGRVLETGHNRVVLEVDESASVMLGVQPGDRVVLLSETAHDELETAAASVDC